MQLSIKRRPLERSPTPPSVHIRELLDANRLTQDQLADAIGVSRLTVNQLVNDKRSVTPDMAIRLEKLTGISASHWLTLQQNYDLWWARRQGAAEHQKIQRLATRSDADVFEQLAEEGDHYP
jgi:addiction module HigA family antidote